MSEPKPHVERLKQEYGELNEKITDLTVLMSDVKFHLRPAEDQALMAAQLSAMQAYSNILSLRLNRAKQ